MLKHTVHALCNFRHHSMNIDLLGDGTTMLTIHGSSSPGISLSADPACYQLALLSDIEFVPSSSGPTKRKSGPTERKLAEENLWYVFGRGRYNPANEFPGGVSVAVIDAALLQMREGERATIELSSPPGTLQFKFSRVETAETSREISKSYREALTLSNADRTVHNPERRLFVMSDVNLARAPTVQCWADRSQYFPLFVHKRYSVFLRCRRFGKSVFIETLAEFFRRPAVYTNPSFLVSQMAFRANQCTSDSPLVWNPSGRAKFGTHYFPPCPVAVFDFLEFKPDGDSESKVNMEFKRFIQETYLDAMKRFSPEVQPKEIDISNNSSCTDCLLEVIMSLSAVSPTGRIVVLVDEYDSLLNRMHGKEQLSFVREKHEDFYECLMLRREAILCCVVTGVMRWSLHNLFSGANEFYDLTLDPFTASLCGLTEEEVGIMVTKRFAEQQDHVLAVLKKNLNRYRFSPCSETRVYSPHYVMLATIKEKVNGWSDSGESECIQDPIMRKDLADRVENSRSHTTMSVSTYFPEITALLQMPITMTVKQLKLAGELSTIGLAAKLFFCGLCTIVNTDLLSMKPLSDNTVIELDFPCDATKDFMESELLAALRVRGISVGENYFSAPAAIIGKSLSCSPPNWLLFFTTLNQLLGAPASTPQSKEDRAEEHCRCIFTALSLFYRNWGPDTEEGCVQGKSDIQEKSDMQGNSDMHIYLDPRSSFRVQRTQKKYPQVVFEFKVKDYGSQKEPINTRLHSAKLAAKDETTLVSIDGDKVAHGAVKQTQLTNYSLTMRSLDRKCLISDVYRIGIVINRATGFIQVVEFEGGMQYHVSVDTLTGDLSFVTLFLGHEFYTNELYRAPGKQPNYNVNAFKKEFESHQFNLMSFMMAEVDDYRLAGVGAPFVVNVMNEVRGTLPPVNSIILCRKLAQHNTMTIVGDFVQDQGHIELLMKWLADKKLPSAASDGNEVPLGLRLAFRTVQFIDNALSGM